VQVTFGDGVKNLGNVVHEPQSVGRFDRDRKVSQYEI
jgi:hypothetical protein